MRGFITVAWRDDPSYATLPEESMNMRLPRLVVTALVAAAVGGCGDNAVNYSDPVSLKLSGFKEGDIRAGTFDEQKNVNTETGNPYAEFLRGARNALGGADPGSIGVDAIVLTAGSDSTGVGSDGLGAMMQTVEVYLTDDTSTVPIGRVDNVPMTATTLEVPVTAETEALRPLYPRLIDGSIKVGVRGNARAMLPSTFDLKVNVQITFAAYE